ncbi:hypothetical protein Tco_0207099 [Tanacetum coccineum]
MPKFVGEGFYACTIRVEYEWKPLKYACCKTNANTSGNKKKNVERTKEDSNSNLFDVLNLVENDDDLVTNGRTLNLAIDKIIKRLIIDEKVTLVVEEGKPLENVDFSGDHDSEDEVESVDNEITSFLASMKVSYGTNSLLKQLKETYGNADDFDPYDDDMYEGQETPD